MKFDINLKQLKEKDVTKKYVEWFKNSEIVKYSNNQYKSFSIKSQKEYIKNVNKNVNADLYGIFIKDKHIGNVLISDFLSMHKRAEISYILGEKELLKTVRLLI